MDPLFYGSLFSFLVSRNVILKCVKFRNEIFTYLQVTLREREGALEGTSIRVKLTSFSRL